MNQQTATSNGEPTATAHHFRTLFPATRRGAHRVRHAAGRWLDRQPQWGRVEGDAAAAVALLIAELTANAALHGRVRGRRARLALTLSETTVRIEVTDARGDRLPRMARAGGGESGRGLLLVASLADAWGCEPHHPGGKTVWAEYVHAAPGVRRQAVPGG